MSDEMRFDEHATPIGTPRPRHDACVAVAAMHPIDVLRLLPDDPFTLPDTTVLRAVVTDRARYEHAVIALLDASVDAWEVPARGYRATYLVSLLGEWRAECALPTLLAHLSTPWGYGWDELIHAITRVGPAAIPGLLFTAFDGSQSEMVRRRALRALGSIGIAAMEFGDLERWPGDAESQRSEIAAALRLMLHRRSHEPAPLVEEAAARLCDLRYEPAWPEIRRLFATGQLVERDGFTAASAHDTMRGRLLSFDLGGWRTSMIDWLTRTR